MADVYQSYFTYRTQYIQWTWLSVQFNYLCQVLEYGNSVRSKGATGVNPDSSRSHAVLQMEIRDADDKRLGR